MTAIHWSIYAQYPSCVKLAHATLRALPRPERRGLVAARIMGAVYADLLARLERRAGDLIVPRVRVPKWRKLWGAFAVWVGVRA